MDSNAETNGSSLAARLKRESAYYARGLFRELTTRDVFLWAQAIAFKVLITIVPLIVLATGVMGGVLRYERPFEAVATFIRSFLPPYESERTIGFLQQLQDAAPAITVIGSLGLLATVITLFTTLRVVVAKAFKEEWHQERSILRGYAFDVRMVVQVGLLFLLSLTLSVIMQWLNTVGAEGLALVGLSDTIVATGWQRVLTTLGLLLPFLLTTGMFFQLFYFIPRPHPPKRSALLGALVTALLWEVAKLGFTFYATSVGQFDRYGGATGTGGIGGLGTAFGLIIAFVFWVYYSGIVFSVGAIIALLHEKRRRARRAKQAKVEAVEDMA